MTTNATYPLKNVSSQYGAPMGRRDTIPDDPQFPIRLSLVRLSWVDYDYDQGGAYWGGGTGEHIYRAVGDAEDVVAEVFVRAKSREAAKSLIRQKLPAASFLR